MVLVGLLFRIEEMCVMYKKLLVLFLMLSLLFGSVSSAPSTTSPASEFVYIGLEAAILLISFLLACLQLILFSLQRLSMDYFQISLLLS